MSHFPPSHSLQGSLCKLQLLKMESQLEQHCYDDVTELGCCNRNQQVEDKHAGAPKAPCFDGLLSSPACETRDRGAGGRRGLPPRSAPAVSVPRLGSGPGE